MYIAPTPHVRTRNARARVIITISGHSGRRGVVLTDIIALNCGCKYKCLIIREACSFLHASPSILQTLLYKNNKICIFLNHD